MLTRESYLYQNINILFTVNKNFKKSVDDLKRHVDFLNEQNIENEESIHEEHPAIEEAIEKLLEELLGSNRVFQHSLTYTFLYLFECIRKIVIVIRP